MTTPPRATADEAGRGRDVAPAAAGVVIVGAINVDLVVSARRLPGPGETVLGGRLARHGGGKGANAAVAAARAGASVRLIGAVGSDENGRTALDELRAEGIDVTDVAVLDDEATGVALIVVDPAGENQIAVAAGANMAVSAEQVRSAMRAALPSAGCVLVSTEIAGEAVAAAVEAATAAGVRCVLNPAPVTAEVAAALAHGPLVTPNATESIELAALLGSHGPADPGAGDGNPGSAAARRIAAHSGAPVVVTLGGDGAFVLAADGNLEHVPPRPATVRDTTGAGDTFNGVLASRLAAGDDLRLAVQLATVAASLSVAHAGARDGMPSFAAIDAAMSHT
jgi:ribokinase